VRQHQALPGSTVPISVPPFRYNTHRFTNDGPDTCVTVVLTVPCTGDTNELESAAYLNSFNPLDLCENYLGDAGSSVAAAPWLLVPRGGGRTIRRAGPRGEPD